MSKVSEKTDICVIGAGPVGLFAVFQAGMLKMNCHVVDTLDYIGGQCTALYPEKPIYDIPGFPSIDAAKLIDNLEEQASPFNPTYHLSQQVTEVIQLEDGSFNVKTSRDVSIDCKVIIIAAGCGAFGPNRPPIANIEAYEEAKSIAYMVRTKEDYRGKKVAIAGGGDSAVDWANILADVAEKLYVIHRRDKFRAAPDSVEKMRALEKEGKIEFLIPYQPAEIIGSNGKIEQLVLKDLKQQERKVEIDNLLCFFGLAMELGPIAEWGLNLHKNHIAVEQKNCETSTKGIYAVGDICDYEGKLKLISCGFSEAAMATHDAYNIIHDKPLHFEYSTTKGVPDEEPKEVA